MTELCLCYREPGQQGRATAPRPANTHEEVRPPYHPWMAGTGVPPLRYGTQIRVEPYEGRYIPDETDFAVAPMGCIT